VSFDGRALIIAIALELVLLILAAFGGPHGALGGLPWVLQLPGILLVFVVPGESWFVWRVVVGALVQVALWYALIAFVRRRRSTTA
jgi:hypothetical protein